MPYKTREQAIAVSASIGCEIGAHKQGGEWLPCRSSEEYQSVKKAKSFKPNDSMISNAKRGLELREKYGRGGLSPQQASREGIGSGVARARDIINGNLSLGTVKRMRAFFERHEKNKDTPPSEGNGKISWLLWGGDAGRRWANSILREEGVLKMDDLTKCNVAKVDKGLGLIFGWAIVCTEDDRPYYDTQGDYIPEDVMLKASSDFMQSDRVSLDMHNGESEGQVVFAMPITKEIADSMGILTDKTGLMIAVKPDSDAMLERYAKGEYTGFSIGGKVYSSEDVE